MIKYANHSIFNMHIYTHELDKALEQALKSDKPAIVDVVVDPDEIAPIIKGAAEE
jgi:thiamine pyrophosphate-dependent acetolactate synthase large subunit-like protein